MALNPPVSAGMLRRLAEAADCIRNSEPVWFTAMSSDPTAEVFGPFVDEGSALRDAEDRPAGYDAFGPYITEGEMPTSGRAKVLGCAIWARTSDGSLVWNVFSSSEVDAIFLTDVSLDKFAVPYMSRLYGPDYAADWRTEVLDTIAERGCCHKTKTFTGSCPLVPLPPDPAAIMARINVLFGLR